ncbi:MAG: TraM recognition domain-containing protein [Acidobacteria bacterium]|nr:TraM recognition domain-containing protein [Acidobacteriota bacterium]
MPLFRASRVQQSTVLDRAPLEYTPRSSTTLNDERLNSADPNFWNLALRFRPNAPSADEQAEFTSSLRLLIFFTACFVYIPPMLHVVFGPMLPLALFGFTPTAFALFALYRLSANRAEAIRDAALGWAVVLYSFVIVSLDGSGSLLPRISGSVVGFSIPLYGYALLAFFLFVVGSCCEVYVDFLAADPKCTHTPAIEWWLKREGLAFAGAVLFVVPAFLLSDAAGTVVLGFALALGVIFATSGFSGLPARSYMYLTRQFIEFRAPGVWLPHRAMQTLLTSRQNRFTAAVAAAHLVLAVSTFWLQLFPLAKLGTFPNTTVFGAVLGVTPRLQYPAGFETIASSLILVLIMGTAAALTSCVVVYGWAGLVMLIFKRVETLLAAATSETAATAWETYAGRLQHSSKTLRGPDNETIRESDHFYLGYEPYRQFPVMLHRPLLQEHCHVLGDSGSGKTSLGLIPLLRQIIDNNAKASSSEVLSSAISTPLHIPERAAVLILDLKGDMALFETARGSAQQAESLTQFYHSTILPQLADPPKSASPATLAFWNALIKREKNPKQPLTAPPASPASPPDLRGTQFRFFTPEPRRSHVFNPFNDLRTATGQSKMQIASVLLDALALNHGEGYGRSYYSKRSRDLLLHAIDQSNASNFEELYVFLNTAISADPTRYRDAFELVATIRALTSYPQLVTSGQQTVSPEHVIHMPTVLEERQVVYFWLPSVVESVSVREIGKLALYSLVAAALSRRAAGLPVVPTYVFIDEFQRIAGENFKVILQQARSLGIGVILSNQSMADLKTADVDLRSTVRTNTRVKMYFSVQDAAEVRDISDTSGLDAVTRHTASVGITRSEGIKSKVARSESVTTSVAEKARLTESDIREISDHPRRFVLHVSRGSGLTQFGGRAIPVECTYTMGKDRYDAISASSLPDDPSIPSFATAPSPAQVEKQQAIDQVQSVNEAIEQAFEVATEEEGIDPAAVAVLKKRKTRKKPKDERKDG